MRFTVDPALLQEQRWAAGVRSQLSRCARGAHEWRRRDNWTYYAGWWTPEGAVPVRVQYFRCAVCIDGRVLVVT